MNNTDEENNGSQEEDIDTPLISAPADNIITSHFLEVAEGKLSIEHVPQSDELGESMTRPVVSTPLEQP